MHPSEDWAETFSHYLHIRDTLQTAASLPGADRGTGRRPSPPPDRSVDDFRGVIAEWLPLTYALNAINRSMGRDDLYPFVLARAGGRKLAFVHELVTAARHPG